MQEETYDWDVAWLEALDSLTSQDLPMLHASDSFIKSFPADGPTMPTNVAMPLSDRDRAVSADTAAASDAAQSLPRDTAATLDTPLSLIQTVVSSEISAVTHESEAVSCHDASLQSPESQGGLAWNAENQKTNLDPAIAGVSLISLQPNSMEAQGGADAQPKEAHCTLGTFSSSNDNAKELQHLAAIPPESDIHGLPTDCSTTGGRLAGAESLSAGNLIADTAAAICDVGTTEAESPPTEITSADTAAAGCDAETAGAESPPAANVGASDATAAYSDTKMVEAGSRPTENASASKAVAASNDAEMAKAGYPLARHTSVNETVAALEMAEAEHQPTASTSPNQVVGKVMEKPRITCIDNSAVSAKVSVPRTGSKPEQEFHIGINLRSTKCLENKMKRGSRDRPLMIDSDEDEVNGKSSRHEQNMKRRRFEGERNRKSIFSSSDYPDAHEGSESIVTTREKHFTRSRGQKEKKVVDYSVKRHPMDPFIRPDHRATKVTKARGSEADSELATATVIDEVLRLRELMQQIMSKHSDEVRALFDEQAKLLEQLE